MYVKQILTGTMNNFSYLVAGGSGKKGAVIDPGCSGKDVDIIVSEASGSDICISHVITTHTHRDHVGGVRDLIKKTGAKLLLHQAEAEEMTRMGHKPDMLVTDGDLLDLDGLTLKIIHTPGHSRGSICIYSKNKLFTGDTLFVGGCGRADLPGGNPEELYHSLYGRLMTLPDDTEIYPGHNYGRTPASTIGTEKETNKYLMCRSLNEFLRIRMGSSYT